MENRIWRKSLSGNSKTVKEEYLWYVQDTSAVKPMI